MSEFYNHSRLTALVVEADLHYLFVMPREPHHSTFRNPTALAPVGLTGEMLASGITHLYRILDGMDETLMKMDEDRLAQIFELANFSSMVGNILRSGISKASRGLFKNNGPHKYPDLLSSRSPEQNVESKVALEDNNPKGHLAKEGYHLTARYVLCDCDGIFARGKANRGVQLWVWEVRFGYLRLNHFNTSSTPGDSGKTAVVNAAGMVELMPVYVDFDRCPYSARGKTNKELKRRMGVEQVKLSKAIPR